MSLGNPFASETVTILTAGTYYDPYSQTNIPDWGNPTRVDVQTQAPCEPRPSPEPVLDARNAVTIGWTVYLPPGTVVDARNRIEVRGEVCLVDGEPADWMGAGVIVQAKRIEG